MPIITAVASENDIPSKIEYLLMCKETIEIAENQIKIFTLDGSSFHAEFINFRNDSLIYYDSRNLYLNDKKPLIEIKYIITKNNNKAFDGAFFRNHYIDASVSGNNYSANDLQENYSISELEFEKKEYSQRQTVALEKIAKAQIYFMAYSIVTTLLGFFVLIISL